METKQGLLYQPEESARASRMRRVIIVLSSEQFSQIEAIALLGGFPSIEEYSKSAVQDRFELDQEKCRVAMSRPEAGGGQEIRKRKT